jgi:hypothetical protein
VTGRCWLCEQVHGDRACDGLGEALGEHGEDQRLAWDVFGVHPDYPDDEWEDQ